MARLKKKAQTWHLKGTLGLAAVFVAGLFVSGAFGGVSPLGLTSTGATDTGTSASSSSGAADTGTASTATTDPSSSPSTTTSSSQTPSTVPYIVTFAQGTSDSDQTSEISAAGATDNGAVAPLSMHTIDVPADSEQAVVAALQAEPNVADVERDHSRETDATPSDPGYADQWNLPMIGWDQAYGSGNPLGSSTIAVLDTGVSGSTGDLNLGAGWSAFGTDPTNDPNGHGTAVASIAAATADNGIGIAGVDFGNATIEPVQVLDANGLGQDSDIIQGVVWAADHGANVILMSFSNPGFSQALQDAVNYAWGKGAVVVAATGNDGVSTPTYPAGDADVMGVAGTDQSDQPWTGSNTGADTFLAAPATSIPADATDGSPAAITGTSASAAEVAGAAALLLANDPNATNAIVDGRLARNADAVGTTDQTGNGRLNLARAAADTGTDPVTPLGAPGGGGPMVNPYAVAANNDANIAPEWAPGNTSTLFNTLYRVTTGGTVQHVRVTLPSGYTNISAGATAFSSGTWGTPVVNQANRTVDVSLSSGTGLAVGGWARIDIQATTPNVAPKNNGEAQWLMQTFTDTAGTTGTQSDTPAVDLIESTTPSATVTFVDGSGNPITNPVLQNGVAATVRARITQAGSGIKYVDVAVPTCFSSPTGVTTTVSTGGNGSYAPTVTDGFIRMPGGSIPTNGFLTVQFTTTPSCTSGTYTVSTSPSTNATNPPSGINQTVSESGGSLTVAAGLADLSITKTDSPDPVGTGKTLTYTIGVHNGGPDDASAVKVVDTLPAGVTFVSATGTNWTCNNSSGTVTCNRTGGNLAAGTDAPNITITVTAPSSAGTITNSATVSSPNDNTPGNDTATATTTVNQSDLAVTKTDGASSVNAGGSTTYTIRVTNNGPSTVSGATLTDAAAAGLSKGTISCSAAANNQCSSAPTQSQLESGFTLPTLANNQFYELTVQASVTATSGSVANTATVAAPSGTTDPTPGNNSATDTDTVNPVANLAITKTDGVSSVSTGGSTAYTIRVTNNGPSTVSGASLTDAAAGGLNKGTIACSGAANNQCSSAPTKAQLESGFALPTLSNGQFYEITVQASVTATSGSVSNTATVAAPSGTTDPDTSNNTATDTDTVGSVADLSVTKTDNKGGSSITSTTGSVIAGAGLQYTVVVSNGGPSDAVGATVADNFPGNFTGATWSATGTTGTSFTASGSGNINTTVTIPSGGSITYTISGTVSSAATGTLSNTASAGVASGTTDPTSGNNSATDQDTVTKTADLSVTKTDNKGGSSITPATGSVVAGSGMRYTVVVSNAGPSDAVGATVADSFPANFTGATWTATQTGGATGFSASGSGNINDTVNMPAGSSITYSVTGTVSSSATGTLSNTATVTAAGGTTDPSGNNSATDNDTITRSADLSVTKTDDKGGSSITSTTGSVVAGSPMTYMVTVSNAGPSSATGASVTDTFPSDFSGATWTATQSGGATGFTASGSGNINDTVNMPAGSTITYTVTGTVASSATGTLSNTANASVAAGTTDPTPGNNSATDTDAISQATDLSITKTDGTTTAVPGSTTTYTINVTNAGPSTATGASVVDVLPGPVTSDSWTAVGIGGANGFAASGTGNINDTVNFPVGATVTYTVTAHISSSATGNLTNTATVAAPSGATDPTPGNNSSTDTDTLTPQADLSAVKSDDHGGNSATATAGSVVPGTPLTYTVTFTNSGPSDSVGANLVDSFPSDFTGASWTAAQTGGATGFSASGSGSINDTATMPAGSTITYTVTGNVESTAAGTLSNTATASDASGTTDPAPGNNSATDTDNLTPRANVTLTKTDGQTTAVPGTPVTYTISVGNAGPSAVSGATVADNFSSQLVGVTWSATQSGGATGASSCASGCGNLSDTVSIPVGGSIVYTVTGAVASSATGTLDNTATITMPAGTTNTGNGSATDSDNLTPQANVSLTKTDGQTTAVPGTPLTYTVTASNSGPSDLVGATVHDAFPSDFTGASWTAVGAGGASGFTASGTGDINDTVDIPVGGSVIYTVTGTVASSATGTLSNTATITMPAGTTNSGNGSATDTDNLTPQANLSLTKTDGQTTAVPGTPITYTVTVGNATGPSDVSGAVVSDNFSSQLSGVTWTATQSGGATGASSCSSSCASLSDTVNLPVGSSITYTISGTIKSSATGTLANTATVTVPDGTTNTGTSSATDTDNLTPQADLTVVKSDDHGGNSATATTGTVIPGTTLTYTVTVSNAGPSDSVGATVTDIFPSDFSGATWTATQTGGATGFTANGSGGGGTDTVNMPAGSSITYTITGIVKSSATGTLSNTASAADASGTTDTNGNNNSATDTDNLTPQADLGLTKDDGTSTVVAGTSTTYNVTLTNHGPSDAPAGQIVSDAAPAGTTISSSDSRCAINSNVATCTTDATLAAGHSTSFALTLAVDADYVTAQGASLTNTASITNTAGLSQQTNAANDTASDTDTVVANADLGLTKDDGTDTVTAGKSTTYTVTLTNHGPSDTPAGQVVTDAAPAGTTISSADSRCAIASNVATCTTDAALPAGQSTSFALTLAVDPNYVTAHGSSLENTVSITDTAGLNQQTNAANDSASDTDTVIARADLSVTKSGPSSAIAGSTYSYTLTVKNNGPSDNSGGFTVSDTLSSELSFVSSSSCNASGQVVTCTEPSGLAAGSTESFTFVVKVDPATPAGTVVANHATVASNGTPDDNNTNDQSPDTLTTITSDVALSLTKSFAPSSVTAGDGQHTFTLKVTNTGTFSTAHAVHVTDTVDPRLVVDSISPGGYCAAGPNVDCTFPTLAAGTSATVTVTYHVAADTPAGSVTNIANAASPDNGASDSATDTLTITSDVALSLTKTFTPNTVIAGSGDKTFTLVVKNTGQFSTAHSVEVTDQVDPKLVVTGESGGDCSHSSGQSIDCTFATLAAGDSATVTVTYHVDPDTQAQQVGNSALATSPDNGGFASASDTLTITSDAALTTKKTFAPASVVAGDGNHTFTIAVTNSGQFSTAHSVDVTDPVDPKLAVTGISQDQGANGTCDPTSQTAHCTFTLLPAGQTATITVTYHVAADTPAQQVDNTAFASTPDNPNQADGADTLTITSDVHLSLTKTFTDNPVTAGDGNHTFTLAVTNTGDFSTAHSIEVTDQVDSKLVVIGESGGDCSASNGQSIDCTFATLAAGQTATVTVTYHVDPATKAQAVDNTANASTPDNNASATDTKTLEIDSDAALSLTKTFDPTKVTAGDGNHTFTLTVKNTGTFSTAHDVHVTDSVPGAIAVDAVHDDQGDTNCAASSGQNVNCTFALLPAGQTATVTVSYHVDPATSAQNVENTADAATPDNNTPASDTKTLEIDSDVTLHLDKAFTPDTVTAGDGNHTFTLAVTNGGTFSTAHSVEITDTVDSRLVVTGVSQDQGGNGSCAPASPNIDCTFALLPHGQTATVTVTYHVDPSTSAGTVTNNAIVTSPDNSQSAPAQANLTIERNADLQVTKTAATNPTQPNTDETFTVTVKNNGPSDNAGYTLTDAVPANTTFVSASAGCAYDSGTDTVTCTSTGLAFNATDTFTITVHLAADYPHNTKLSNTASIASSATPDSVSGDDSSTVTVDVASIALTKSGSLDTGANNRADAGDTVNYTFSVENTGSVALTNAVVTDPLTGTHCTIANLDPGATDTTCTGSYTLSQSDVDAGSVANTAHVSADAGNGVQVSDDSTANVDLPAAPSIDLTKTPALHQDVVAPNDRVDAGDQISYVFSVQNTGNVTLTNVTVTDPLTNTNCSIDTLAPGQTDTHCTALYTLTQSDVDRGSQSNTATATGTAPQGGTVSDDDTATVDLPAAAALQLQKATQSAPYDHVGQQLDYTYTLTNTGNVTLGGPFTIQDDKSTDAACPASPNSIGPGETITCTGTYHATQADLDAGSVTNHATATADFKGGDVTSNQDQAMVQAIQKPSISLTKQADTATYDHVGQLITYTYTLKNTGNVTLSYPSVTDDNVDNNSVTVSNGNGNGKLNVDEAWTFTATHTVTQADLDNGSVTNNATGHATFNGSPVDSTTQTVKVLATQKPSLTLTKVASAQTYDHVGQVITYTYTLQNSGNVTLGTPSISDDNLDPNTQALVNTNGNGNSVMEPGEIWTFKGQRTVTDFDIIHGQITNTAVGSAPFTYYGQSSPTPINSNVATTTVGNASADVAITKSASPDPVLVNDKLTYTLTVTNNAPAHSADNVKVTDPIPSNTTLVSASATNGGTCDSSVTCTFASLPAGASATVTIVVTPTSSGQITNTASVLADEADPNTGNNTASVTTTANPRPTTLVYTGDKTQDFNDPFTASAKLTDTPTGNPIAGKTISFKLNNTESCSGTTNASGVASCSMTPGEPAGTYNVTASFAGDSVYTSSDAAPTPFVVKLEETATTYTGPTGPIQNGTTITLSGVLKEDGATPIQGRTLTLSLGSQSCTGTTSASGIASCSILVNQPLGPGTAGASFAGDTFYLASNDSKSTLIYASASGGNGAFVVGDNSATGSVYFWGSQWWTMNSLSGGAAPAAFKGFAKQPGTPSCGATWSTDPGNSAPPPAGPLPSYIAVIVTSKATKSGSQITGNIVHIVIVKTGAGYSSDPGHPGTGTVVATVC